MAAEASESAAAQGAFWPFHDALYEDQGEWAAIDQSDVVAFLVDLADDLGLDAAQMEADLENRTYEELVANYVTEAGNLGLPGTPALIVNGELLQGVPPFEAWAGYIESQRVVRDMVQYDAPPEVTIDESKIYVATVMMASGDQFVMELYPASAPLTVNSFVFLANEGWFDGVTFHRVLPGFVAQTGDPTGTGTGSPGYQLPNEIDTELTHAEVGMVAMANSGPDTNGSQWYITLGDASFLDGGYTIFGRVVEGMEAVERITPRDPSANPNAPAGDVIESIEISEQ